ncbi:MAG: hypothetical protein CMR00_11240 [[Chlorobium] sp. 445]|nr:MAG: hypothetical protein CMR00_11240 [[Chlorobium] sp. 445]
MLRFLSRTILPQAMRRLYASLRKSWTGDTACPHEAVIVAFWHGKMLTGWLAASELLAKTHASARVAIVSLSKDGEILANALHTLGYELLRGSSSRGKDAVKAGIQAALHAGRAVVMTPDGPRGPRESFKYGAIRLAAQCHAPILFLAITHHKAWKLGSWDAFEIPKPFSKVEICVHRIDMPEFENEQALRDFSDQLSKHFSTAKL